MKITAVTFRNHPINNIFVPGGVPHILGMGTQAQLFRHLRAFAGEFVQDCWITPATVTHHAIVQVKKTEAHHEGLQVAVGFAALTLGSTLIDAVTLVDEDINIYDYAKVDWAIATRCNPKKQVHILPEARCHQNNPIAGVQEFFGEPINRAKMIVDATIPWKYRQADRDIEIIKNGTSSKFDVSQVPSKRGTSSWLRIDATKPVEEYEREGKSFPSSSEPPEELMARVRARWKDYGFKD